MNDLIERIEAASEDNADLFRAAATAVFGFVPDAMNRLLAAGAFTDAAMTLVPEGAHFGIGYNSPGLSETVGHAWAWVRYQANGVWEEAKTDWRRARHPTIGLAICAASVKASAYLKETNNAD